VLPGRKLTDPKMKIKMKEGEEEEEEVFKEADLCHFTLQ
jgi:hypothetical protein